MTCLLLQIPALESRSSDDTGFSQIDPSYPSLTEDYILKAGILTLYSRMTSG